MKRRMTFRVRFAHDYSVRVSAINLAQAQYIAAGVAKKHNWKIESIGRI